MKVANCFWEGKGISQDYSSAFYWYSKAAEQDHSDGTYYLGLCYEKGYGVDEDIDKAIEMYKKAANRIHIKARERFEKLTGQAFEYDDF